MAPVQRVRAHRSLCSGACARRSPRSTPQCPSSRRSRRCRPGTSRALPGVAFLARARARRSCRLSKPLERHGAPLLRRCVRARPERPSSVQAAGVGGPRAGRRGGHIRRGSSDPRARGRGQRLSCSGRRGWDGSPVPLASRVRHLPSSPRRGRPATRPTRTGVADEGLATAPTLIMRLTERGALGLDDPIAMHIPLWRDTRGGGPGTVRDLLTHCSGLPAHLPLFQEHTGRLAFERAICTTPLAYEPRTTSLYSDLGFILLGFMLEDIAPLPVQFDTLLQQMGGIQELRFHPPRLWRAKTAPTRRDEWRKRILVGEVDDNNACALGGAAGHAGLFGTAQSVGECARHLLQVLDGRQGAFQEQTLRTFISRRTDIPGSSRALAWDTMLPTSSCGTRMSPRAFGHTGFTGTSLWIDPGRRDLRRAAHESSASYARERCDQTGATGVARCRDGGTRHLTMNGPATRGIVILLAVVLNAAPWLDAGDPTPGFVTPARA